MPGENDRSTRNKLDAATAPDTLDLIDQVRSKLEQIRNWQQQSERSVNLLQHEALQLKAMADLPVVARKETADEPDHDAVDVFAQASDEDITSIKEKTQRLERELRELNIMQEVEHVDLIHEMVSETHEELELDVLSLIEPEQADEVSELSNTWPENAADEAVDPQAALNEDDLSDDELIDLASRASGGSGVFVSQPRDEQLYDDSLVDLSAPEETAQDLFEDDDELIDLASRAAGGSGVFGVHANTAPQRDDAGDSAASDERSTEPVFVLVVDRGADKGKVFRLSSDAAMTIGRRSADIVLNDRKVSRTHAKVWMHDGQWFIQDMNSTNGTFVKGTPTTQAVALKYNRRVQIGSSLLSIRRLAVSPILLANLLLTTQAVMMLLREKLEQVTGREVTESELEQMLREHVFRAEVLKRRLPSAPARKVRVKPSQPQNISRRDAAAHVTIAGASVVDE